MDKTWMTKSRLSVEYEQGVREFLEFAFSNTMSNQILCPCRRCVNSVLLTRDEVYEHLIIHGILKLYKNWYEHGEQPSSSNANIEQHDDLSSQFNVNEILEDEFGMPDDNMRDETTSPAPSTGGLNNEAGQFFKFLDDANKELYPGCARFTKLTFIVRLYHIKCLSGWSNKSLDLLLALLKEALPEGETLPVICVAIKLQKYYFASAKELMIINGTTKSLVANQSQCTVANNIISLERLNQYMHVSSEAPVVINENRPAPNWPPAGRVELHDLKVLVLEAALLVRCLALIP